MQQQRFLFPALWLLTAWRLALLATHDLGPQEALAVAAAHHAGWNWLGVGPLMPLLARVGTMIFGENEFGVRFLAPWLMLGASLCLWRLARGLYDQATAAWTLVVVNVLPVFNLAAITLTPGTVSIAMTAGMALCLRIALHRTSRWHPAWFGCAGCLMLGIWADALNLTALLVIIAALGIHRRRRHHLLKPGFGIIYAGWLIAGGTWLAWDWQRGWPWLETCALFTMAEVLQSLARWIASASPALLVILIIALRHIAVWRVMRPHHALLLGFTVPLMALDFLSASAQSHPVSVFSAWMIMAVPAAVRWSQRETRLTPERRVMLRTVVLALSGLQSLLLMQTDMLRHLGVPWRFAQDDTPWPRDPSGEQHGWRRGAEVISAVLAEAEKDKQGTWMIITDDWRLAAPLAFYLRREVGVMPADAPSAYTFWPRYDAMHADGTGASGMNAIFITADADMTTPPRAIADAFEREQPLSVARHMHGGHEVRTLKIFACHTYRPPDL
jgi:hypothetical protein